MGLPVSSQCLLYCSSLPSTDTWQSRPNSGHTSQVYAGIAAGRSTQDLYECQTFDQVLFDLTHSLSSKQRAVAWRRLANVDRIRSNAARRLSIQDETNMRKRDQGKEFAAIAAASAAMIDEWWRHIAYLHGCCCRIDAVLLKWVRQSSHLQLTRSEGLYANKLSRQWRLEIESFAIRCFNCCRSAPTSKL